VRELLERYFMAGDTRDEDMLLTCFAKDGEMSLDLADGRVVVTRDRIGEGPRNLMSGLRNSVHALSGSVLKLDGDQGTGTVLAVSYLAIGDAVGGTLKVRGLRYDDEYVREDGRWVFRKRHHAVLWQYETTTVAQGFAPKDKLSVPAT
jgi:SnoaL-like domain